MMIQLRPLTKLLLIFLALNAGCWRGSLKPPQTAPVSGMVTYQGKPAPAFRVTLHPVNGERNQIFHTSGETGADGKFVLSTGAPRNGAPVGEYVVTIQKPQIVSNDRGLEVEVDVLKGAYSDPAKSAWKVTIKNGDNVLEPFNIE